MKLIEKYRDEVLNQIKNGYNFEKDPLQNRSEETRHFAELAKKYRYRRSKTAYYCTGNAFYYCLQKVYYQMKARGEI